MRNRRSECKGRTLGVLLFGETRAQEREEREVIAISGGKER